MNTYNESLLAFLKNMALQAGKIMLENLNSNYQVFIKPDGSKVTEIDLKISAFIQHLIKNNFPEIKLFSEETENKTIVRDCDYFIVDELDGTHNFIENKDNFCHAACYYDKNEGFKIGVIYIPIKDIMLYAIKNHGAFISYNNKTVKLEKTQPKSFESLIFASPDNKKCNRYLNLYKQVGITPKTVPIFNLFDILGIFEGIYDVKIFLKQHIHVWDWAAIKVILNEIGFDIFFLNGEETIFTDTPKEMNKGYILCHKEHLTRCVELFRNVQIEYQ